MMMGDTVLFEDDVNPVMSATFDAGLDVTALHNHSLRRWSKDEQRAVFRPVAVVIFVMAPAWFGGTGILTTETLRLLAIGLPAVRSARGWGSISTASWMRQPFRAVVLVVLLLSGFTLLPLAWMPGS